MALHKTLWRILTATNRRFETTLLVVWSVAVWLIVDNLNLFERLYEASRAYEEFNIDEIFSVLLLLPFALFFLIWRRNKALEAEIKLRLAAEERISWLAYYDALTGLPNRNLLEDRLAQAIARAKRSGEKLAILFLDLDGFKEINDNLGHAVGDEVLRVTADHIKYVIRDIDTAVRLGGDEFCILLAGVTSEHEASRVAQRLIDHVEQTKWIGAQEINIGLSIGITLYSGEKTESESNLLHQADSAMYEAKRSGKGRFCIYKQAYKKYAETPTT